MTSGAVELAPSVVVRHVLDEVVLVDVSTGSSCALDPAGARLWALLESAADLDDAVRRAVRDHAATPEIVRSDLLAFISDLEARGLIRARPTDGRGRAGSGQGH